MPPGGAKTYCGEQPLIGYRMYGVPCGICALPMHSLWLFRGQLEAWHLGTMSRCRSVYLEPAPFTKTVPDRKPDTRRLSRRYGKCVECGVRFVNVRNGMSITDQDKCKSCRLQTELFTHDEITKPKNDIPSYSP